MNLGVEKKSAIRSGETCAMDRLRALAQNENCKVIDVASDGNCMFSALAHQLKRCKANQSESAEEIRAELVTFIKEHPEMVSTTQNSPLYHHCCDLATKYTHILKLIPLFIPIIPDLVPISILSFLRQIYGILRLEWQVLKYGISLT